MKRKKQKIASNRQKGDERLAKNALQGEAGFGEAG